MTMFMREAAAQLHDQLVKTGNDAERIEKIQAALADARATAQRESDKAGWKRAVERVAVWLEVKAKALVDSGGDTDAAGTAVVRQQRSDAAFIRGRAYEPLAPEGEATPGTPTGKGPWIVAWCRTGSVEGDWDAWETHDDEAAARRQGALLVEKDNYRLGDVYVAKVVEKLQ